MGDRFYCQRDKLTLGLQPDRKVRTEGTADYFKFFPKNKSKITKKEEPDLLALLQALMVVKK